MVDFWLDSDIQIAAKEGALAFDIAPRFWANLDYHVAEGRVSSPVKVYEELTTQFHDDELAEWVKTRKDTHYLAPDDSVYAAFTQVADYVVATYGKAFADVFLDGADPWLIAYAMAHGGSVVTGETTINQPNPSRATGRVEARVKIPNVCHHFDIRPVSLSVMLRELGVNDL